jgi:hypothetical protein
MRIKCLVYADDVKLMSHNMYNALKMHTNSAKASVEVEPEIDSKSVNMCALCSTLTLLL